MKDDVEIPTEVPRKRRQLEQALPVWIATWLARDDLTPSERRRLEEEKQRRKVLVPDHAVGVLVGREGMTPAQRETMLIAVFDARPTEIHHPGLAKSVHRFCTETAKTSVHSGHRSHRERLREIVMCSSLVIGAVRSAEPEGTDVWEMIRYAKHRRLPVRVVLPSGELRGGEGG